jgi:ubiquinone biosynthesis protein
MDDARIHRGGALDAPGVELSGGRSKVIRGGALRPQRLRDLLVRLGPLFVKIGQFLALRPDLLPQEYCDELLQLVDQSPAESWETVHAILTRELGGPPETIFRNIRRRPLAAGSIAQVHLARLHNGKTVAVKVQRPGLEQRIYKDLRRVRWLMRAVDWSGASPFASPDEVVAELERWLRQELDFTRELRNQQRMYDAIRRDDIVRVPRPYAHLSTARVLTGEYLPGLPLSKVMRHVREGNEGILDRYGLDKSILAERLIETALDQIFRIRFFHADMHPGNLIAMRDNVLGLVDFGLTDVLDTTVERRQADFLSAIYNDDVNGMYRAVSQVFNEGPRTSSEAFRRDFFNETNRFVAEKNDGGRDGRSPDEGRSYIADYMVEVVRLARVHDMRLPSSVLALYRTLLASESVANQLHSDADLASVGRGFFRGLEIEKTLGGFETDSVIGWLMQINDLVRTGPRHMQQVLSDLAEGRFVLPVRSHESEQSRRAGSQRARMISLAVVSVALAMLLSGRGNASVAAPPLAPFLWAALVLDLAALFFLWRRLK